MSNSRIPPRFLVSRTKSDDLTFVCIPAWGTSPFREIERERGEEGLQLVPLAQMSIVSRVEELAN